MANPKKILFYLAVPIVCSLLTYWYVQKRLTNPADANDTRTELIEVADNQTFRQVASLLQSKKLIHSGRLLSWVARIKGADKSLLAGEYELSPSMTPLDILKKLSSGQVFQRKVVFPEGTSIRTMGDSLEKAGVISAMEFNKALSDSNLLMKAGITSESFEGYLFPDTYQFSRPITAERIIWKMLETGESKWKPDYTQRQDQLGLTRHEVLTFASIIEKESGDKSEQPVIASVFYNRLKQQMKLQSDPTVIYGIQNFNGNITKQDLETPTPYNTYTQKGLPPGPICNPGDSAIRATLYPETTSYLYFVANGKGGHVFSSSLAEHNKWVAALQKKPSGQEASTAP